MDEKKLQTTLEFQLERCHTCNIGGNMKCKLLQKRCTGKITHINLVIPKILFLHAMLCQNFLTF